MDEPIRLVCPECGVVYRIKKLKPGKGYHCKKCGSGLRSAEAFRLACPSCGLIDEEDRVDVSTVHRCRSCQGELVPIADFEKAALEKIASENVAAASSSTRVSNRPKTDAPAKCGGDSDLSRLPRLVEDLTASLAELRIHPLRDGLPPGEDKRNFLDLAASLEANLKELNAKLSGDFHSLDDKVARLLQTLDTVTPPAVTGGGATLEIDMNELADKLAAGLRAKSPRLDADSGSAVDALARVADEIVKEQSSNTARLDNLAEAIKTAVFTVAELQEWKGALPGRVADEIGRTVEERVVGPISGALARQAPAILAELKDDKLVDIVSRSVREAQRPLLREILSGGKAGVPVWLFASVLIPLLLILGYLFLPGELGFGDGDAKQVADTLSRMEVDGLPLAGEAEDRLAALEEVMIDIRDKAMEHAGNSAALGEEVKGLRREMEAKDKLLKEYTEELQRQVRFKDNYKTRLVQLGVSPESVRE